MKNDNLVKWSVISIMVSLYLLTSTISTIHVINFFELSNPSWLAITLAIAFEVGAAASLAAIIILDRSNRLLIWSLFIIITLIQINGNMYYAYTHLSEFRSWSELFGMIEEEPIFQKRILSVVSGAILPIVALGFIKSLVDYIRPSKVEDIKSEFEADLAIKEELKREEKIENPIIDEPIEETISEEKIEEPVIEEPVVEEPIEEKIEDTVDDTERERVRKTEQKLAKIIAKNPDIKKQIEEKLREYEDEDKYTKSTEEPTIEIQEENRPRIFRSGM